MLEYLAQEMMRAMSQDVPIARKILLDLAQHAQNEAVRLQAAKELLDRGGLKVAEKHEFLIRDERTDEELEASIRAHAEELGLEVRH